MTIRQFFRNLLHVLILLTTCGFFSCLSGKYTVATKPEASEYEYIGDAVNGWSLMRADSLWGYLSKNKRRMMPAVFDWAGDFSGGRALVKKGENYTYINRRGRVLDQINTRQAYPFTGGLAAVALGEKWGYINRKGAVVIRPQFDWAQPFSENRAAVTVGYKKGYIGKKGEMIIAPEYEQAQAFKKGVAIIRKDRKYGLIDPSGKDLLSNDFYKIEPWADDFYRLSKLNPQTGFVDKFGLADAKGRLLLDTVYTSIELLKGKFIRAKKDSLVGLFDLKGKVIIPMEYSFLGFISSNRRIAASKDGKWGFLNTKGKVVLPFQYQSGKMGFSEGRTWVYQDSCYMLMDAQFKIIKKFPQYRNVFYFSNGYAIVGIKDTSSYYDGNVYGFIDKQGNEIIPPKYNSAWPFNPDGITVVGIRKDGLTSEYLINTRGELLADGKYYFSLKSFGNKLIYNSSSNNSNFFSAETGQRLADFPYTQLYQIEYGDRKDLSRAYRGGKVGLIDTELNELLPLEFDQIKSLHHSRLALKKGARWGFADEKFRIRIPMSYDKVDDFRYPLTEVVLHKKKGAIDRYGRQVIPLIYDRISFDFGCDRIYCENGDLTDIYDMEGRLLQATDYEYVGYYGNTGYAAFRRGGKLGFMDYYFRVICEPQFDGAGKFYDGLAWVSNNKKGGYINTQFQLVIPIQFDYIENFALGFAKVKKGEQEYYIDTRGEPVVPTEAQIKARDKELERRKRGMIDFSS